MPELTEQVREALEERARGHDGERLRGRCQVLSLGDDCPCRLCFAQETAAAVARALEAERKATVEAFALFVAGPCALPESFRRLARDFLAAGGEHGAALAALRRGTRCLS